MPGSTPQSLDVLNARIITCDLCPRLRAHCTEVARVRRRAYADWEYWGRPVPSFGDPEARVLALGLAPGAHGSNRTGRPFTGDGSGDFLYPVLHAAEFASHPQARSRDDGMQLTGLWITSVVALRSTRQQAGTRRVAKLRAICRPGDGAPQKPSRCSLSRQGRIRWPPGPRAALRCIICALRLPLFARSGVLAAERFARDCQLSSVVAEHQHGKADATDVPASLQAREATGTFGFAMKCPAERNEDFRFSSPFRYIELCQTG